MELETGKVYTEKRFLPIALVNEIRDYSTANKPSGINLTEWNSSVVGTSGPIMLYRIESELKGKLTNYILSKLEYDVEETRITITYTLGSRYSYIPWHDDLPHPLALTVYLNETWDLNWAGAFMYDDGSDYKAIYPEFNKAIYFKPPVHHCTIMPNIQAPLRESLQFFVD